MSAMPSVCFATFSRSDYASLRPVIRAALSTPTINTQVIVGGSHLLHRYGKTIDDIRRDGIPIDSIAQFMGETDDSPRELAAAFARATTQCVEILSSLQPDYVFALGDRWEMFAFGAAAAMLQIPIVHHSGGDITQGSADNQNRYALSTLAHLHLTALPEHRERLLRMGEEEWRVITTGEPALSGLLHPHLDTDVVSSALGIDVTMPFALATFHPTSFERLPIAEQVEIFLQALTTISCSIVLTAPNPDAASELFLNRYREYASVHANVRLHHSLGTELYYAAMAHADFMIGNSSSGIWESASFRLPVVNIGPRQHGRVHGNNVIHCELEIQEIANAISVATSPNFKATFDGINPYVDARTIPLILDTLTHRWDQQRLLAKRFIDPMGMR